MDAHTAQVQAAIQQLVIKHGEYASLELLLATNRLGYDDSPGADDCKPLHLFGSTKIRGVKRRDRLPSEGRASVRGRRLDVQPSMSATLTPRILVLPSERVPTPALRRGLRPRLRLGGPRTATSITQIQINNGRYASPPGPPASRSWRLHRGRAPARTHVRLPPKIANQSP